MVVGERDDCVGLLDDGKLLYGARGELVDFAQQVRRLPRSVRQGTLPAPGGTGGLEAGFVGRRGRVVVRRSRLVQAIDAEGAAVEADQNAVACRCQSAPSDANQRDRASQALTVRYYCLNLGLVALPELDDWPGSEGGQHGAGWPARG